MEEPIGAVAKRKRQQRIRIEVALLILLIIVSVTYVIFTTGTSVSGEAIEIVMGPGEKLEVAFIGPYELQVKWDNVIGHEWSVSLIEGRIRNISSKTVEFENIIYRVKDEQGTIIWEESDSRFANGGSLGIMQYFNFATQPVTKSVAKKFEVVVQNPEIIKR